MPLSVRVCSADRSIRKYLPIDPEDTVGFFELIRRKFHIRDGEDLVLVDEQEGFGIDDDVLGDVVTSNPTVSLMVLKEDEEWSGSDVHSITSADTIKVDTSSSSLSSSESDSSFCSSRKRPRLNALSESGAITDNSCEVRLRKNCLLHFNLSYHNQHNIRDSSPIRISYYLKLKMILGEKKYI
eukprot:XP_011672226.1 PREDICTED: uncharacterized protein LOC105442105 isoform X1 [Strongylocentrotus purpuratus]